MLTITNNFDFKTWHSTSEIIHCKLADSAAADLGYLLMSNWAVALVLFAVALDITLGLPFPFELGGSRDDGYDYLPRSRSHYLPRPRMGGRYYGRSMFGRPRYAAPAAEGDDDDKDEDEEKANREKIAKALEAQEMVVDTVLPFMQSLVPSLGHMMPLGRKRRSSGIPTNFDDEDQLSMPSEASLLMVPSPSADGISQVTESAGMIIGRSSQQPGMEVGERLENDALPQPSMTMMRSMPSFLPAFQAQMMPIPHATIRSGKDDKIYFAVDRKTVLDFLSALFGGEMRSALSAALHDNNVLQSHKAM